MRRSRLSDAAVSLLDMDGPSNLSIYRPRLLLKIIVRSMRIFSVNLTTFEQFFISSVVHLVCHRKYNQPLQSERSELSQPNG